MAGRKVPLAIAFTDAAPAPPPAAPATLPAVEEPPEDRRRRALDDETVRSLLDVFPVAKTTVEDR